MSNFPDFSCHGYQIQEELGRNREGGRITWSARHIVTGEIIVLKQFCFATAGSTWSGFNAWEREIEILQRLDHPGIPKYLGSFPTSNGFCLIQEYKNAPSVAIARSYTPAEIKLIAVRVLEILVYLQSQFPIIIHRDIKPENILLDERSNVYLIDFGLATLSDSPVSASSIFGGTPGFIPPEQIIKPTEASDLYALGATLICLLTGKKSTEITELIGEDSHYLLEFEHLLPKLNLRFVNWLKKMVQPDLKNRYSNAQEALDELLPLDLLRSPDVKIDREKFQFASKKPKEILTQKLLITNSQENTLLAGNLVIIPDLETKSENWITLSQKQFVGDRFELQITVDTSKLPAGISDRCELLLKTNGIPETYTLPVTVQTAELSSRLNKYFYGKLLAFLLVSSLAFLMTRYILTNTHLEITLEAIAIAIVGAIVIIISELSTVAIANNLAEAVLITLTASGIAIGAATAIVGMTAATIMTTTVVLAEAVILAYLSLAKGNRE